MGSNSGWRTTLGNVRSFIGNSMGGLKGSTNLASWVVAGTLAYFLWVKPSQQLKKDQQVLLTLPCLPIFHFHYYAAMQWCFTSSSFYSTCGLADELPSAFQFFNFLFPSKFNPLPIQLHIIHCLFVYCGCKRFIIWFGICLVVRKGRRLLQLLLILIGTLRNESQFLILRSFPFSQNSLLFITTTTAATSSYVNYYAPPMLQTNVVNLHSDIHFHLWSTHPLLAFLTFFISNSGYWVGVWSKEE